VSIDPGSGGVYVQITLSKVYDEVVASRQELRDLMATIRPIAAQVSDHEARMRYQEQTAATKTELDKRDREFDEHFRTADARLTAVERWRWTAGGIITMVSMAGGALIGKLISGH
jgi:hypothetical protein